MALSGNKRRRRRHAARFYAVQALFQMEAAGIGLDLVRREFLDHRFGATDEEGEWEEGDPDHFTRVLEAALEHQVAIDQATDRALVASWPMARIDPTLRAIFRAAGAELRALKVPPKAVISEYIDIARAFFPEGKAAKLVNAVLDHMARAMRPEAF